MAVVLVGRDEEVAAVTRFIEEGPAPAAGLLIEGEPGIGKTTLWQAGIEEAAARSYLVLSGSPGERETDISFATAADLLSDVLDEALPELPGPQRTALEVALLRVDAAERPLSNSGAVAFGFLGAPAADMATIPPRSATLRPLHVRRRDLLGGLLHEYEAAA